MITTILSMINLIKTSNNVFWNIFHKTLILSVFIHVNNFILSQLRQPPTTHVVIATKCKVACILTVCPWPILKVNLSYGTMSSQILLPSCLWFLQRQMKCIVCVGIYMVNSASNLMV